MKHVLVLKNITHEDPGLVEIGLEERNWPFHVVDLNLNEKIPEDVQRFDALVVLGGPASANDETQIIQEELSFIHDWAQQKKPYLGICLGLQLMVKALGGKVHSCSVKEIGFLDENQQPYQVHLTRDGKVDPLFENLDHRLNVFQLHGEHVELNESMKLLAFSEKCAEQVVKFYPKAYGIQCHFELTENMLGEWAQEDEDLQPIGKEILLHQYAQIKSDYENTGTHLVSNFLNLIENKEVLR